MSEEILNVDMSQMRKFGELLELSAPEQKAAFDEGILAAAEIVAVEARHNARSFPRKGAGTDRIASSLKVKLTKAGRVSVQAGGNDAPEAAPIENHGLGGKFRHPVFGNYDNWVSQQSHPFLTSAFDAKLEESVLVVEAAVDVALKRLFA